MKYEFHVGDYVETKDGDVGYVTNATYTKMRSGYWLIDEDVYHNIDIVYHKTKDIVGEFHGKQSTIPNYFNRIGQYDFTKPNTIKIEFIDGVNTSDSDDSAYIIDKINELVEAVNRLQKSFDDHQKYHDLCDR